MKTQHANTPNKIKPSFSGHETFPFRYTWLKKGVDAVKADPAVFSSDRSTITLGVGKNMVRSIRHWCAAAGLIQAGDDRTRFEPTKLGNAIFADDGFDPYLEDSATLWLIHTQLAVNASRATTWYWAFGVFAQNEFRKAKFTSELLDWDRKKRVGSEFRTIRLAGMSIAFSAPTSPRAWGRERLWRIPSTVRSLN